MKPDIYQLLKNQYKDVFRRLKESPVKRIYNLSVPHFAFLLSFCEQPFIVIEDSPEIASALHKDFLFFNSLMSSPASAIFFPPVLTPETAGERAKALLELKYGSNISAITSKDAFMTGFSMKEAEGGFLTLIKSMDIERDQLNKWLNVNGYKKVAIVVDKGEFSQREWIFDIYPSTGELPFRMEFFGDNIDIMRTFEIENQRSIKEIDEITIFPAHETEPKYSLIEELSSVNERLIFLNEESGISIPEIFVAGSKPENTEIIATSHFPFSGSGIDSLEGSVKGLGILPEERKGIDSISGALERVNKKVAAIMRSEAQAERLKEILSDTGIISPVIDRKDIADYRGDMCISTGNLSSAINLPGLLMLTDREIFGQRPAYRPIRKSRVSSLLMNIDDMKPGDFVVHKDHGIGRFTGVYKHKTADLEEDLIIIEYANGKIYVPLHGVDRINKYSAAEGHIPAVDKLGTKNWLKTKQKVRKGIQEMAQRLVKLYAERKMARGFMFSEDTPMHKEFDDFFPYEETPDQITAVEEIKRHLSSETPMDMLLCGDVGYGKTEVAARAAFRVVYDGKQAAILVPTTLLAEQHYRTFRARFSGFPVNIDILSRFKDKKDIKNCVSGLKKGEIDIVIGTHMLLNKDVGFHDLGLLIIDEEHRFGVAQKERLKELKKGADVLTLTATPIPRTLHMSLSGIREMCVIETPPEERLAVRSIVATFNEKAIAEAIERELKRNGQVFFLHNRIADIKKMADFIKRLAPDASVEIAHGQMNERELENIMMNFLDKKIDILVCTAIIGAGLDITTANTLIVNRADSFGLSDLYQIRGRVGRGNIQAYAYFLIPGEDAITDEAKKRLRAIQEMSYLGAGFRLALKDLEIRGAGNLLGAEQSGHIYKVGFDMYMEMLEKAVSELKGEEIKEDFDPQIKLRISAFIPENYIQDITLRLSLYKRISKLKTQESMSEFKDEVIDRFGNMPAQMQNLLKVIKIKMLSRLLYISNISETDKKYRFTFLADPENRYKIPGDFFDKMLKALFKLQKKERGIRFLPDGFELNHKISTDDSIKKVEDVLINLWKIMEK